MIKSAVFSPQTFIQTLSTQQNDLYKMYNKIQTNQNITNISENPIDAADLVRLRKQLSEIETYAKNVEKAKTQINAQDEVFSTIYEKMNRINELAIQAASATSGETGFKACQAEIEELTKSIVNLANTQYDNKYLFAGTNVTTAPFVLNNDGSISYQGITADNSTGYERTLEILEGTKVELNSAGDTIFGMYDANNPDDPDASFGLFKVLGDLNKIMKSDPADHEAVSEMLGDIQDSIKHVSEIQATHSITVTRLDMTTEILDSNELNLTSRVSEISEVDMVSAISELMKQNQSYQASMQAYSLISNQSLLDYI